MRLPLIRTQTSRVLLALLCATCAKRGAPPDSHHDKNKRAVSAYVLKFAPEVTHPLDIAFDDSVKLIGYDIDQSGALPRGKPITLTLYWTLTEPLEGRWKILTHVLDPYGGKIADLYNAGPLRAGRRGHPRFPPSSWSAGRFYVDEVKFTLPPRTAARRVSVVAGIYRNSALSMTVTKGEADERQRALVASFDVAVEDPGITLTKLPPVDKIAVDGRLDEPAWGGATVLGPFIKVERRDTKRGAPKPDGSAPTHSALQARARMLWNNRGLYLGYEVHDENLQGDRPDAGGSAERALRDAVVLVVDPDQDGTSDYEIQINPQNLQVATRSSGKGPSENSGTRQPRTPWLSRTVSAVMVDGTLDQDGDKDRGYVVEAMIPWASFGDAPRHPPAPGDTWKMNLYSVAAESGIGWAPALARDDFRSAPLLGTVVFAGGDSSSSTRTL